MCCMRYLELIVVDAASHCIYDRLGLLEDLLLHEVLIVALHDLLYFHHELLYLAMSWLVGVAESLDAMYGELAFAHHCHVVVLEKNDLVGMLDDGAGVRREKVLDVGILANGVELGLATAVRTHHGRLYYGAAEF